MLVRAFGVPHRGDVTGGAVDEHDVTLIGRSVTGVAAGGDDHPGAVEVERGAQLLLSGVEGDPDRPVPGPHLAARGQPELVDPPVRAGGVHVAAIRIGHRSGIRDLGAALVAPMSPGTYSHSRAPVPGSMAMVRP